MSISRFSRERDCELVSNRMEHCNVLLWKLFNSGLIKKIKHFLLILENLKFGSIKREGENEKMNDFRINFIHFDRFIRLWNRCLMQQCMCAWQGASSRCTLNWNYLNFLCYYFLAAWDCCGVDHIRQNFKQFYIFFCLFMFTFSLPRNW